MRRANPVIEFVGLPGAGKSTIAGALPAHWPKSPEARLPALPLARRLAIGRAALPLMLSLRPLRAKDVRRLAKIAAELRFYERAAKGPLVIDQGMIQKLWSILLERRQHGHAALERLVAALAPSAPDLVVVLATPPEVAAQRLLTRNSGNARLQKRSPEQMMAGLVAGQAIYRQLLDLHHRHCDSQVLELSGEDPVAASAARVVAAVDALRS